MNRNEQLPTNRPVPAQVWNYIRQVYPAVQAPTQFNMYLALSDYAPTGSPEDLRLELCDPNDGGHAVWDVRLSRVRLTKHGLLILPGEEGEDADQESEDVSCELRWLDEPKEISTSAILRRAAKLTASEAVADIARGAEEESV